MRNTIRKVTMVVPVLMTSCHVSEKRKSGPVIPQTTMIMAAAANAHLEPSQPEARAANLPNQSFVVRTFTSIGMLLMNSLGGRDSLGIKKKPRESAGLTYYAERFFKFGAAFFSSSTLFFVEYFSLPDFGFSGFSGSLALFSKIGLAAILIFSAAELSSSNERVSFSATPSMPSASDMAIAAW